jgi:hypothetical protein
VVWVWVWAWAWMEVWRDVEGRGGWLARASGGSWQVAAGVGRAERCWASRSACRETQERGNEKGDSGGSGTAAITTHRAAEGPNLLAVRPGKRGMAYRYRYRYRYRYPYTLAAGSWAAVVLGTRLALALDSLSVPPCPRPCARPCSASQHPSIPAASIPAAQHQRPMSVALCLCATPARLSCTLAARAGTRIEPRRPVAR